MDMKDEHILDELTRNARLSAKDIAKKVRMPITTVHNRIKRLEHEGIITGYTTRIDYQKIDLPLAAFILITVDYKLLKEKKITQYDLVTRLKNNKQVAQAAMLTGGADIIIKVRAKDISALNEFVTIFLRNIDGIEKTQTAIVLNEA